RWLIIVGFEGVIAPHTLDNDGAVAGLPDEEVAAGAAVHGGGADAGVELVLALAAVQGLVVAGADIEDVGRVGSAFAVSGIGAAPQGDDGVAAGAVAAVAAVDG